MEYMELFDYVRNMDVNAVVTSASMAALGVTLIGALRATRELNKRWKEMDVAYVKKLNALSLPLEEVVSAERCAALRHAERCLGDLNMSDSYGLVEQHERLKTLDERYEAVWRIAGETPHVSSAQK